MSILLYTMLTGLYHPLPPPPPIFVINLGPFSATTPNPMGGFLSSPRHKLRSDYPYISINTDVTKHPRPRPDSLDKVRKTLHAPDKTHHISLQTTDLILPPTGASKHRVGSCPMAFSTRTISAKLKRAHPLLINAPSSPLALNMSNLSMVMG